MVDLSLRSHLWLLNRSGASFGQRPVECWGFEGGPRQVQHERIRMLTERCGSFPVCQATPVPAELWALTDPANGAVIDVDADQLALPTVTYVRDATDRIVARTATGEGTVRYAHSGAGDAPQVTLNTSNQVTRVTVALPGGGIYHHDPVSPTTSKWSYPNLQGTIAAQANMSGVKLGATMIFDPDGIPVAGGTADTRPGSMDDAWFGGHARPVELLPGLQPVIEMGARQYSPVLGRFLETDPVEGGCSNDYNYPRDSVNQSDLTGMSCTPWVWSVARFVGYGDWVRVGYWAYRGEFRRSAQIFGFQAGVQGAQSWLARAAGLGRGASRFLVPVSVLGSAVDYACSVDSMPPAGPNRLLDNYDHLGRPVK